MNITKHASVLSALDKRALRYRRKGQTQDYDDILYDEALDETGTVDTERITNVESDPDSTWLPSFNVEQISRTTEQQEM